MSSSELLLRVLRDPSRLGELTLAEWDRLIPAARDTGLFSRLAVLADDLQLTDQVPSAVLPHLKAGRYVAAQQDRAVRWEVDRIRRAVEGLPIRVLALKGTAYLLRGLSCARGRLCSDVDVLVSRDALAQVEAALKDHGWVISEKDQRHAEYFRKWLHELPPMMHAERKMPVDIHHSILPRTDTLRLRPDLLLEAALPLDEYPNWHVLQPTDLVLHASTHLFRNGDFQSGLRDLSDIDGLLREFSRAEGFWGELLDRAEQLDLRLPCHFGLRFCREFLETPVPANVSQRVDRWAPSWPIRTLANCLVRRATLPMRLDGRDRGRTLSIAALSYWPLPRPRAMMSSLFWAKRLPRRRTLGNEAVVVGN